MKTVKNLFLLCLLTLIVFSATAQSDYRPGYIVTTQGDTLQGLVSYRSKIMGANSIGFKANEETAAVNHSPSELSSYGFPNDKNFQSKLLDHADTLAPELVFMEELVRGSVSLYIYNSKFFVEKQEGKLHKLYTTYEEYYNSNGALARKRVNHHVSVLNMMMLDCFQMLQRIERVKLTQRDLVGLVQAYNQCVGGGEQIIFKEKKPWLATRFGIVGGISHTSLNFSAKDERYLHLEHATFNSDTYPSLGLALNLRSPRISGHTSLQLEGQYFKSNYQAQATYTWFDTQYENEMEVDLNAVKLGISARYDFSGKMLQPYVNAGTFLNFYQKRDFRHMQFVKRTSSSEPEVRVKDDPAFVGKQQQGLMAGVGTYVNLKGTRLSTEIRYEHGFDLHTHEAVSKINEMLSSNTKTFSLLLGLYF